MIRYKILSWKQKNSEHKDQIRFSMFKHFSGLKEGNEIPSLKSTEFQYFLIDMGEW